MKLFRFILCAGLLTTWMLSTALAASVAWDDGDGNAGTNSSAGWNDVQTAIRNAEAGNGTFGTVKLSGDFQRAKGNTTGTLSISNGWVTISGGWNSDFTALSGKSKLDINGDNSGNNRYGVISVTSTNVVLTNLFVTGGWTDFGGAAGISIGRQGTDRAANKVTLTDLIISNNWNNYGGAGGIKVTDSDEVLIRRCEILKNSAGNSGGGISVVQSFSIPARDTGTIIESCNISQNNVLLNNGAGGGVSIGFTDYYVNILVANCRITGNTAYQGAGVAYSSYTTASKMIFVNCLIQGNRQSVSTATGIGIYKQQRCYMHLINCTVADNINTLDATKPGLYVSSDYGATTLHIFNSVISSNNGVFVNSANSANLRLQRSTINESVYAQTSLTTNSFAGALAFASSAYHSLNDAGTQTQNIEQNLEGAPGFVGMGKNPYQLAPASSSARSGLTKSGAGYTYIDAETFGSYTRQYDVVVDGTAPAGTNYVYTTDLLGTARLYGSTIDRGAYQMGPPDIFNTGVSNLTATSATLYGFLSSTGAAPTDVTLLWGTSDPGATWSGWAHTNTLGASSVGAVSTNISGLAGETLYFYRFVASNAANTVWADASTFSTPINPTDYFYRMKIQFPGYTASETLTNFTALVIFTNNMNGLQYSQFMSTNGWDLRFQDSTGLQPLNYEVEKWDTNGASYVWVQVPELKSGTWIWAYWRNAAMTAAPPVYTTNGSTWATNYVGVWHMAQTNAMDSTANKFNGTAVGTVTQVVNGVIGPADAVQGSSGYVDIPANAAFTLAIPYTVSAWVRPDAIGKDQGFLCTYNGGSAGFIFGTRSDNYPYFWANGTWYNTTAATYAAGVWKHVVYTCWSTTNGQYYINGAPVGPATLGAKSLATGASLKLGSGWVNVFNGRLDEVRLSSVRRSANWIQAGYSNQVSNPTFVSGGKVMTPATPVIASVAAANVQEHSADMIGLLSGGDTPATVTCYWGTNNGGTVASAWMTNTPMGDLSLGYVTNSISSGLISGAAYYFRFFASNSTESAWADDSVLFSTPGRPSVDNGGGAANVTQTGAQLRGTVLGGAPSPQVWIYWGTSDGTTNKGDWNLGAIPMGTRGLGVFSTNLSSLPANQTYWYNCYASNNYSDAWAPASVAFTTAPPSLVISDLAFLEGAQGSTLTASFTVSLSATSSLPVSVDYITADGTAKVSDNDIAATNGTLTIQPGAWTGIIPVTVVGDNRIESDEIFYVNLNNGVNVVIGDSQGQCAITNDDWTLYVRGDGGGSDANGGSAWNDAFATLTNAMARVPAARITREPPLYLSIAEVLLQSTPIRILVQASAPGQAYDVVASGTGPLDLDLQGGWENVTDVPVQTGISVVKDLDGTIDEPGISLINTTHYQWRRLRVDRFAFTNVTRGVEMTSGAGWTDKNDLLLIVSNTTIHAKYDGIYLLYMHGYAAGSWGGTAKLIAGNVDIIAGQSGFGHGVNITGAWQGSSITASGTNAATGLPRVSTITSATGDGVRLSAYNNEVRDVSFANTVIYNCATNGVHLDAAVQASVAGSGWSNAVRAAFVNCTIAGNGVDGVQTLSSVATPSWIAPTNSIFANNSGRGINMDGNTGVVSCVENYNVFFNSGNDIFTNGLAQALSGTSVAANPMFYGKDALPSPWYTLGSRSSPAFRTAADNTSNRGAYQNVPPQNGTMLLLF